VTPTAPLSAPPLSAATEPLVAIYDVALLDLDGVVYIGAHAVAHAADTLREARRGGMRLAFVTNNAARPPADVARHLTELGIDAGPDEVITSAQAAATYLAERLPPGAPVLVVGTTGLVEALTERGLRPVSSADDEPVAIVQGYSPTLDWALLAEGAVAIRRGALWVATNVDPSVPSPRGPLPGNGATVAALRHATGATPVVTGKPDPTMHRESVRRAQAKNPIVVGDRLDTDIEGANAAGCASLLVLTGVTSAADLLAAPPALRPTYLAPDLRGLLQTHPAPTVEGRIAHCGQFRAELQDTVVVLSAGASGGRENADSETGMDALRALCAAAWLSDAAEPPVVIADGNAAAAALESLGLSLPGEN
jgi:glycerol 3-phosphatase-2